MMRVACHHSIPRISPLTRDLTTPWHVEDSHDKCHEMPSFPKTTFKMEMRRNAVVMSGCQPLELCSMDFSFYEGLLGNILV
ncbi:hypothetical protein CEXT_185281 [Caerostris extrusa]|uniref:Uncharacterized protein n=1 Tax=Caerostris extrusa TaxID=172846 RepID=A0AAV4XPW7_CAEEX|nr:hypothetical protein CEXT_185281 [Caerostris extrusa]